MLHARVRRNHLFEDGFQQLQPHGSKLKQRLSITFVSDLGYDEPGIDGGGLWLLNALAAPSRSLLPRVLTGQARAWSWFICRRHERVYEWVRRRWSNGGAMTTCT